MPANEITIQELTGSDPITVTLRGRAMPYRGMPTPSRQRIVTTFYQGNPVATQQIMGIEYPDTELTGMWKAKFLRVQDARVAGNALGGVDAIIDGAIADEFFGASNGATILVALFERLLARGNELLFSWGPISRYGLLKEFTPSWQREEDVEWSMSFEWSGAQRTVPRTSLVANPGQDIQQGVVNVDSAAARVPSSLVDAPQRRQSFAQLGAIRNASIDFLALTRQAAQAATLPARVVQGALAQAIQVRDDVAVLSGQMMDVPYTYMSMSDSVVDVFSVEVWRRDVGRQAESLAARSQKTADQLSSLKNLTPDYQLVTVGQGQTLRHISLIYYGNADDWTIIAEANRLPSSVVAAGTVVRVPTRPSGRAGELVQ